MKDATVKITALAARLGLTARAIRRLEELGCFASHTPGEWTYPVADVDAWLARATNGQIASLDDVGAVLQ